MPLYPTPCSSTQPFRLSFRGASSINVLRGPLMGSVWFVDTYLPNGISIFTDVQREFTTLIQWSYKGKPLRQWLKLSPLPILQMRETEAQKKHEVLPIHSERNRALKPSIWALVQMSRFKYQLCHMWAVWPRPINEPPCLASLSIKRDNTVPAS